MATKKKEVMQEEQIGITIPAIQVKQTKIHIVGDSPLIRGFGETGDYPVPP